MNNRFRLPVSTRHAFALAIDLAVRRDALQSLVIPLLLRSTWVVALTLIPRAGESDQPARTGLLWSLAALGDMVVALVIDAMLRFRARSVFNTPHGVRPEPALECYARGLRRVPWLFVTELVRRAAIALGMIALFVPGVLAAFRLAFATEAVVLHDPDLAAAFRRSFRLTHHRLERWFELMVLSVAIVLGSWFALAVVMVVIRVFSMETWGALAYLLAVAVWPILQYAWTFFYLRLVELEEAGVEVGPLYAGAGAPEPLLPAPEGGGPLAVTPPPGPESPGDVPA